MPGETTTITPSGAPDGAAEEVLTSYGSDPKQLLRYLHRTVKLTDEELVRVTGAEHPGTLRRWRSPKDKSEPQATGRLDDVRAIVDLLVNTGPLDPAAAGRFLRNRNADLDYKPPLTFLNNTEDAERRREEFQRVLKVARALVQRFGATSH